MAVKFSQALEAKAALRNAEEHSDADCYIVPGQASCYCCCSNMSTVTSCVNWRLTHVDPFLAARLMRGFMEKSQRNQHEVGVVVVHAFHVSVNVSRIQLLSLDTLASVNIKCRVSSDSPSCHHGRARTHWLQHTTHNI